MSVILSAAFAVMLSGAEPGEACRAETIGQLTLTETTAVAEILDHADAWVGKRVRVDGKVTDVCEMAGCWLELRAADDAKDANAGRVLRVKVNDGELVFPKSSRGRRAIAEGTVEAKELTREAYESHLRHIADEQGRTFDPQSVGEGPYRVVQIKGSGAEVCR